MSPLVYFTLTLRHNTDAFEIDDNYDDDGNNKDI
jgi:hypothetical protein